MYTRSTVAGCIEIMNIQSREIRQQVVDDLAEREEASRSSTYTYRKCEKKGCGQSLRTMKENEDGLCPDCKSKV